MNWEKETPEFRAYSYAIMLLELGYTLNWIDITDTSFSRDRFVEEQKKKWMEKHEHKYEN